MKSDYYTNRLNQAAYENLPNTIVRDCSGTDCTTSILKPANKTSAVNPSTARNAVSIPSSSYFLKIENRQTGMIEALKLLCNSKIANRIDFDKFGFISDNYLVGTQQRIFQLETPPHDNLTTLNATFRRFSPNDCNLIEIDGAVYYDIPTPVSIQELNERIQDFIRLVIDILAEQTGVVGTLVELLRALLVFLNLPNVGERLLEAIYHLIYQILSPLPQIGKASLCSLNAIAFEIKKIPGTGTGSESTESQTTASYHYTKRLLQRELSSDTCTNATCDCNENNRQSKDTETCQNSILTELLRSNLSHKASIVSGSLALNGVTVLGACNEIIVLANDQQKRFYFICADSIEFLQ